MINLEIRLRNPTPLPGENYVMPYASLLELAHMDAENKAFEIGFQTDADYIVLHRNDRYSEVIAKNFHNEIDPSTGKPARWVIVRGPWDATGNVIEFTYSIVE